MKIKAAWVDDLEHCGIGKEYYFKESEECEECEVVRIFLGKVQFHGINRLWSKRKLTELYPNWRISLEPVPMPEVD